MKRMPDRLGSGAQLKQFVVHFAQASQIYTRKHAAQLLCQSLHKRLVKQRIVITRNDMDSDTVRRERRPAQVALMRSEQWLYSRPEQCYRAVVCSRPVAIDGLVVGRQCRLDQRRKALRIQHFRHITQS